MSAAVQQPEPNATPQTFEVTPRDETAAAPLDVWSRTQPKYRVRAIVLLSLNFVLFCALCVFTHWLHFGILIDFSLESYAAPFRFWGLRTQNLNDFITYPISVHQTPMHGVVLGLLMASIVGVPISVAILYRFASALPFILAIFVLAHLPWMAVTLLLSCVLAAVRPFRMSFRFGSALLGLLPVALYLILATRGSSETVAAVTAPEFNVLLLGPWLLAVLAACGMIGAILLIARLVNYRPGAISPVMGVMFATPLILFHAYVGADELAYRILELEFGPRSPRFEPVQDATVRLNELFHDWTRIADGDAAQRGALLAVWSEKPAARQALKQRIARRFQLDLLAERDRANEACKRFIADFPRSRYLPNVFYIQARVLDTRLDERKLIEDSPLRELYIDFPHVAAEPVWRSLWNHFPASPLSVAAGLRVAQLRLRAGAAGEALEILRETIARAERLPRQRTETQPVRRLLRGEPPEASLSFQPDSYLFEARRWEELIRLNRDDSVYGVAPLRELAALDPRRREYADWLLSLAERYPRAQLRDNLRVRWAAGRPVRTRQIEELQRLAEESTDADALPEALFWLAELEVNASGNAAEAERIAGLQRMKRIAGEFPETIWAWRADEWIRKLEPGALSAGARDGVTQ